MTEKIPFMLRLSKHETPFFSNLLGYRRRLLLIDMARLPLVPVEVKTSKTACQSTPKNCAES